MREQIKASINEVTSKAGEKVKIEHNFVEKQVTDLPNIKKRFDAKSLDVDLKKRVGNLDRQAIYKIRIGIGIEIPNWLE